MSSVEKANYYMESNGYYNGKEVMVGSLAFLSVLVGALLANWLY